MVGCMNSIFEKSSNNMNELVFVGHWHAGHWDKMNFTGAKIAGRCCTLLIAEARD